MSGGALIRRGDLEEGRRQMETAASLDPNNALVRSYLGKAYYEERRDGPAADEFETAKALDPQDPTPWFYDAIRKQSVNRPVEALGDLQRAIELNDNRAVYRSRLLLDEDLAARSASLARIYQDLGFEQRALAEGYRSVNLDPTSFSAHRFLADAYAALPRHEIARVSEVLQAQLLQPLNVDPVPPTLSATDLFIAQGTGPADPGFNEFTPLFVRNRLALRASGVAGGNSTRGDEVAVSGLADRMSFSLGQFYYETDGFRLNHDLVQRVHNAFGQVRIGRATSAQAEFRAQNGERGDLLLRFDPDNFFDDLRQVDQVRSVRIGLRHSWSSSADLLVSLIYRTGDFESRLGSALSFTTDSEGDAEEVQYLFRAGRLDLIAGAGHGRVGRTDIMAFVPFFSDTTRETVNHLNAYTYVHLDVLANLRVTAGAGGEFFDSLERDRDQLNPKLGVLWTPLPGTTIRAAGLRTLQRPLITNQTIEPTQVAGFNQFFQDGEATSAWRYGAGLDQRLGRRLFAGAEASRRDLDIPIIDEPAADAREELVRAYLYWAAADWLALAAEYQYERLKRDGILIDDVSKVRTHRAPLTVSVFSRFGIRLRVTGTFVEQGGTFADETGTLFRGSDRFWVVDGSLGYRLPKRLGLISVDVRNLLDERFRFQDTDPETLRIYPERLVLGKVTVAF